MLLELLNTLLLIDENEMIVGLLDSLLGSPQLLPLLGKDPALHKLAGQHIDQQRQQLLDTFIRQLRRTNVPATLADEALYYQQLQRFSHEQFAGAIRQILQQLQRLNSPFYSQAQQLVADNAPISAALQALFMCRWRAALLMQANAFNQQVIDQQREQLIHELKQRLRLSYALLPVLADNDTAAGHLWDMSSGQASADDCQLILHYSEFLAHQPELLQLAYQLGHSRQCITADTPPPTAPLSPVKVRLRQPGVFPEQLYGVQRSDDILRLLPAEQATFAIAELEDEFFRRMLEKTLLTYQLRGEQWQEQIRPRPVPRQQAAQQPRGAFLVCVDCSGSMGGFNERCAKAFCLALTRIALAEQRSCFIMLFSSELVSYQPAGQTGLDQLTRFLAQRFRGGTNLAQCLTACCDKIQQDDWQYADVVVISDFIAQRLPAELIERIAALPAVHQFHAVATSRYGKAGIMRVFHHIWSFDTSLRARLQRRWQR